MIFKQKNGENRFGAQTSPEKKKNLQTFFFKAANHEQILFQKKSELPWLFRFFRGAWLGGGPASSKAVRAGMGGAAFGGPKLGGNGTLDAGGGQPTGRPTRRSLISITTRSPSRIESFITSV